MVSVLSLSPVNASLLFCSALIGGGLNAIAGGGSFITFPMLVFTGMNPIAANATSNTALWVAALSSARAYRKELKVPRKELLVLCGISLTGGITGAVALLRTSPALFAKLIPWLLLFAAIVFTFGNSIKKREVTEKSAPNPLLRLGFVQFLISVYGGFFGAGAGFLSLAALSCFGNRDIHNMNALKTFLMSWVNGIAVIPFVLAGAVAWRELVVMAIGGFLGGHAVARFAFKIDPKIIRAVVSFVAFTMSGYFAVFGG